MFDGSSFDKIFTVDKKCRESISNTIDGTVTIVATFTMTTANTVSGLPVHSRSTVMIYT